ncbi:hypothetical protein FRC01_002265, partial [Tulasnella sp. 417]
MNTQSTLSRTPRGSLHVGTQRNTPAPPPRALQPPGIYDRFSEARTAIIDLIKNTAWTSNSSEAQASLLQAVDGMADIPKDTTHLSGEERNAMESYIG